MTGLAPDGGLFVPEQIPTLDVSMEERREDDVSGNRIYSYETVSDGFYRRRVKSTVSERHMIVSLIPKRSRLL